MSATSKQLAIMHLLGIALGVYLGMFIAEANAMFQCEKDRVLAVSGLFWKPGLKYACTRAPDYRAPAQEAASQHSAQKGGEA